MITLPQSPIWILAPLAELDYFHSDGICLPRDMPPLEVWNAAMAFPRPVLRVAFTIRDSISSLFGVKKIKGFSGAARDSVKPGDYLDFFLVEHVDDNSLVMTERDCHLDVMICISSGAGHVTVTASVCVHNWFGHVYMLPVGVAHRWIVRRMLKRLSHRIAAPGQAFAAVHYRASAA
ncbi:DUF2867 domain-containing protein [Paracoccus sp. (in: a-proteobacteria)]|uniref:DUF2867 domain-containing protein n=1 Tax=Paracoccus sp. TaxID=267 RepID=UPI003A85554F